MPRREIRPEDIVQLRRRFEAQLQRVLTPEERIQFMLYDEQRDPLTPALARIQRKIAADPECKRALDQLVQARKDAGLM